MRAGGAASSLKVIVRDVRLEPASSSSKRIIVFPPSISQSGGRGEQVSEGAFDLVEEPRGGAARPPAGRGGRAAPVEEQARGAGPLGRGDDVRQAAEAARNAAPHGDAEDLLGDLEEAVELGAAAGQDEAGAQLARRDLPDGLLPEERQELLGAGLEELGELAAPPGVDAPPAGEGHVDRLALVHEG